MELQENSDALPGEAIPTAKVAIPRAMRFFFDTRGDFPESRFDCFGQPTKFYRYKVAYGGRGSGKSFAVAQALILLATQVRIRILCAREFQTSIRESSRQQLVEQIEGMGLDHLFQCRRDEIECLATGSLFMFAGLHHNVSSLKSLTSIGICWVEEADTVSEESWSKLVPSIRAPGSEIWVTFNPNQIEDPTYKRFVPGQPLYDDERTKSVQVSWRDIKDVLPNVLRAELEHLRRVDPDAYQHVWEGGTWTRSDAQVFNGKWVIDDFAPVTGRLDPGQNWHGPYFGADWGFAADPTVLVKAWIFGGSLYVENEAHALGCELDSIPALFDLVPGSREHTIRGDNSRPETINHVSGKGFDVVPCDKWSGSVKDGVTFLRGFEKIVIHPRCKHMAEEARLYSYKTDKLSGDVMPEIVDKHNHCWDALRYALDPMIQNAGGNSFQYYM
jgi:phage terminase large subunit